ncbi:MAG: Holliday junction resolvase RuvX [Lachnospiraceae bacterium]|jgi:putative Holliday junction resolvase|nr:Holliday junction resolvase RuvX [Lachnospiraceae bacterium]
MRIMGLDYGAKTVGVALSDALLLTSQPKETIYRDRESKIRKTFARIEELVQENDVGLIVVGLPLNMDDSEGERARLAREFADHIERRSGIPCVFQDERLTTVEADEILAKMGHKAGDKRYVDQIAASVILQEYMNAHPDVLAKLKEEK